MDKIKCFPKLMSSTGLSLFLETSTPYAKGRLIASYISKIMFIQDGTLYIMNKNKVYTPYKDIDNKLLTLVTKFYDESEAKIPGVKMLELQKKHPKIKDKYNSNNSIRDFLPQLKSHITNEDIQLNLTYGELHFENGFINTLTGEFAPRNETHFITKCIPRKYDPSTEKQREFLMNNFNKIYPNATDRDLVLGNIAICLSWKAPQNQTSLFLLGEGSAGKSFILETLMMALGPYVQKFKSDTLSGSETNQNKILNTLQDECQTLLIWINEMKDQKIDSSVYKDLCDGYCQTTRLYQDGNNGFKHNGYVVATSQHMPNITTDSGTNRRIVGYTHTSCFSDGSGTAGNPKIDEENHIYLKDIELQKKVAPMYNAVIDIFVKYCVAWVKNNTIYNVSNSENFSSSTALITETNDHMQDFIDSRLEIVGDINDKVNIIGKERMKELYLNMYPDRHINPGQLLQALKSRKIAYDKGQSFKNVRGCYMGVKERKIVDEVEFIDEDEEDPLSGEPPKDPNEIKITELLLKLKQLEEDNSKLKSVLKMKNLLELPSVEPEQVIIKTNEIEPFSSEELSTASEEEPEPEPEPPKKLKVIRTKKESPKNKSAFNMEAEEFAKTFKSVKEECQQMNFNEDDEKAIANVFFD